MALTPDSGLLTPESRFLTADCSLRESARDSYEHNELVERIQPLYPRGTFRDSVWILAAKALSKRLDEGVDPELLVEAAECYRDQQTSLGKLGTQFVLSPAKFYGDDGDWRGPFPLPIVVAKKGYDPTAKLTYRPTE